MERVLTLVPGKANTDDWAAALCRVIEESGRRMITRRTHVDIIQIWGYRLSLEDDPDRIAIYLDGLMPPGACSGGAETTAG